MMPTYPQNSQKDFSNSKSFLHRPIAPEHSCFVTPQQLSQKGEGATKSPPSCWDYAERSAYQQRNMPSSTDTQEDRNARVESTRLGDSFDLYVWGREASSIAGRIWRGRQVSQCKSGMYCRNCRMEKREDQSANKAFSTLRIYLSMKLCVQRTQIVSYISVCMSICNWKKFARNILNTLSII